MTDTTPLWIIGTLTSIPMISLIGIFFYGSYSKLDSSLYIWMTENEGKRNKFTCLRVKELKETIPPLSPQARSPFY